METLKSNKARLEYLINDMHREREMTMTYW